MINYAIIFLVSIFLGLSLFIVIYALFRVRSGKKNFFLLLASAAAMYLFGYLLEVMSANKGEALIAIKVLYAGAPFIGTTAFFFCADYCNMKLHPVLVRAPLLLISLAITLTIWTATSHGLMYLDYSFEQNPVNAFVFTPGPLYFLVRAHSFLCIILITGTLIYHIKKSGDEKYRQQLIIILLGVSIPSIGYSANILLNMINENAPYVNINPYSIGMMIFILFFGVIRFDLFDIVSAATITAIDHIAEGFILADKNNNYLSSNKAAEEIFPALAGFGKMKPLAHISKWPEELNAAESGMVEFPIRSGENEKYYRASISQIRTGNSAVKGKIFIIREITDKIMQIKNLESEAYLDSLTGLYTRKHFLRLAIIEINRSARENLPLFTAMLDLDFFKQVNDTYGHAAGDLVLKTAAEIIRNTIRSYDLVCRYGGEEFAILLAGMNTAVAIKLIDRIRENMETNFIEYGGAEIRVTCSIGLAEFSEDDSLEESIKKADSALYAAKNAGRNCIKIWPEAGLARKSR